MISDTVGKCGSSDSQSSKARAPGSGWWIAFEPVVKATEIHGGGGRHVLNLRLADSAVAGPGPSSTAPARWERPFNASALSVQSTAVGGRLSWPRDAQQ